MGKGLSEDELKALTDAEMRQAVGYYGGKLAEMRRKAEYYYLAEAKGELAPPQIDGRSSVVSPDVRNTIESMLPQLMVKFVGGDAVVEFEASKPGDEDKAQQCTDYLNFLFFKRNNGHRVAYTWMKDALLQKVGIVKVWWDTRSEEKREEYRALDDVELAQLLDDPEIEPIEQSTYPDEDDAKHRADALQHLTQQLQQAHDAAMQGDQQAQQALPALQQQIAGIEQTPPKMLYDVVCKRVNRRGKLCIENVPPEEFLISRKAKTIADASFVGHRVARTVSELRSMGYKNVDALTSDEQAASLNAEHVERVSYDDEMAYANATDGTLDESQRIVWVTECYVRCDYDGDGIAELRKVVRAGNQLLENEVVDCVPFVSICPIPLPHRFFGLSIADVAMEGARVKTSILRATLDNLYLQVNGRYYAVDGQANLDDLLTSRPGGVVRVKQPNAVGRLDQASGDGASAMAMLEYQEDALENATGWTRYSQGNDATGLNKTATGMTIVTNRADMRLDLIARNFAEGFVELFRQMLRLVCQYQDRADTVNITGNWVDIDPREWRNQFDVNINVGLGTGNRDQQVQHLMMLGQMIQQAAPVLPPTPDKVHALITEVAKNMGFKNADKFLPPPRQMPPPPPNPEMVKIQAQHQQSQAELQANLQAKQMEIDANHRAKMAEIAANVESAKLQQGFQAQQAQHQNELEAQRAQVEAQLSAQLETMKQQQAMQTEEARLAFERWKAELDANTKIMIAEMTAKAAPAADASTPSEPAQSDHTAELVAQYQQLASAVSEAVAGLHAEITKPRTFERDDSGRVVSVGGRPVQRDENGKIIGV